MHAVWWYGLAGLAAAAAGAVNALAGGGTLISFPALTALGVPPVVANMTNTVALCPGYFGGAVAQWRDLGSLAGALRWLLPIGVLGGTVGAMALRAVPPGFFRAMVPWLILFATALLAAQPRLRGWLAQRAGAPGSHSHRMWEGIGVGLATTYGGFFGAGLGVLLLAILGLTADASLTRLNALKQWLSLAANVAAAVYFAGAGRVMWPLAAVMAVGAWGGGVLGGTLARRLAPDRLRHLVVALGAMVAVAFLAT
ncbi:MAG: sulfite exporter TauE/SafE family protein [Firmicutes bacterium]|nr:sulfite exporter TauE/SafE family protein [Bacillota bacterium]